MKPFNVRIAVIMGLGLTCLSSASVMRVPVISEPAGQSLPPVRVWVLTHGNFDLQKQGLGDGVPVDGARVFIVAENGRELASVKTNREGIADFNDLPPGARPKYVLAERDGFFMSGHRWVPGAKRPYLLDMVVYYVVDEPDAASQGRPSVR